MAPERGDSLLVLPSAREMQLDIDSTSSSLSPRLSAAAAAAAAAAVAMSTSFASCSSLERASPSPQKASMTRSASVSSSFTSSARAGTCFCGRLAVPDELRDDDNEEDDAIYCSRRCARQDALHALLAGSQGPQDRGAQTSRMPKDQLVAVHQDQEGFISSVLDRSAHQGHRKPITSHGSTSLSMKARVIKRASITLSQRYPGLDLSGLASQLQETPGSLMQSVSDAQLPSATLVDRSSMMGTSHYRRMEALSSFFTASLLEEAQTSSPRSSVYEDTSIRDESSYASPVVSLIGLISEPSEREKARIAALEAPHKARARHARKEAVQPAVMEIASLLPEANDDIPRIDFIQQRLGHQTKISDASELSQSSAISSLFDETERHAAAGARKRMSNRSRATTISSQDGFMFSDEVPYRDESHEGGESDNVKVLREELQMLGDELGRTLDAFEFDDDEYVDLVGERPDDHRKKRDIIDMDDDHGVEDEDGDEEMPYESPVGSHRGSPSPNFLGLDAEEVPEVPLPSLHEKVEQKAYSVNKGEAVATSSIFEEEEEEADCRFGSSKQGKGRLAALWKKRSHPSLCTSGRVGTLRTEQLSPISPTSAYNRYEPVSSAHYFAGPGSRKRWVQENRVTDRLVDRLDAVVRARWGFMKSLNPVSSFT